MQGFWGKLNKPFFVLAPMADATDLPFRAIVAKCGRPDVFYTEFVSAHGLASSGRERLLKDLIFKKEESPIVAQFFGTRPEHMYAAAKLANKLGFDGVDVNMGCPDRAIVKQGAGAALIKTPELAKDIILATREGAGSLPVAIKTRLGLYKTEEMSTWIPELLEAKPDVLITHGRTMKEMSKVPAHWDLIGQVARMCHDAGVLCVGNGDITSRRQGIEMAEKYDVDGLMVGRGIFQNPWMFGVDTDKNHSPEQRLELLLKHMELWLKQWDGIKSFDLMKKFYKIYVSGWPGAHELRSKLMAEKELESARNIINEYLE